MSQTKRAPGTSEPAADEQDVEGHNMWIGPTVSTDLARNRSKEMERSARERQRSKDSKSR